MDSPEDFTLTSNGHRAQINTGKIYFYFYICGDSRVPVSFSFFIVVSTEELFAYISYERTYLMTSC